MRRGQQPDLLDWQPPQPVAAFEPRLVQAASVSGRFALAVAACLKDCETPREEVAARMGQYLGKPVSLNMLNAYASQAREDHGITAERLMALLHATGDRRLLEMMAEPFEWAVIERRYLPLIEWAAVRNRREKLRLQEVSLARRAHKLGVMR